MANTDPASIRSHTSVLDADPRTIIVTLFRDQHGVTRGNYRLPPEISADFKLAPSVGENDLLAPIAVLRALQAARKNGLALSMVDPQRLWPDARVHASNKSTKNVGDATVPQRP